MSTLLAAPASVFTPSSPSKLPTMDIRGQASKEATSPTKKRRDRRDAGDLVAKKRLENIRRHSAHTRHRNGIVNAAEKNRLMNTEKQMDLLQRRAAANISRYQHQLKQELYEMEASRRALRHHSVAEVSSETHTDMKGLAKFAARGRYLYSVRNATKSQKEGMESYNGRLEQAAKLLKPARRQSVTALDNGKNMGSNPPDIYHEVGRRISMARLDFVFEETSDDDDGESLSGQSVLDAAVKQTPSDTKPSSSSPPPFDMAKLRSELGPELQKELDNLEIDEGRGMCLLPIQPDPAREVCPDEEEVSCAVDEVKKFSPPKQQQQQARLKLPPVQVNRHFVLGRNSKQLLLASLAKPSLSTVTEN